MVCQVLGTRCNKVYAMKLAIFASCLCCFTTFAAEETVRVMSLLCGRPEEAQTELFFEIPVSRAGKLPSWRPDSTDTPPLSMSAACAIAKKALQVRYSTTNEFEVSRVQLRSMASFSSWYYDIECQTTKFDRSWSPCGMHAVIMMDGGNVEPRVVGKDSDLTETMRQADRISFDIEQQFARARMGDTNALAALFGFSRNVDAAKSPGFGRILIGYLAELGDDGFAKILSTQSADVKAAVRTHLDAGVANTKMVRLQRPIAEAFPITYAAITSQ